MTPRRPERHTHPITALAPDGRTLWTGNPATDASWRAHAACRTSHAEAFFPAHGSGSTQAKRMCAGCPVRFACLESAVETDARTGIWGGLSAAGKQFKRLRRDRIALARRLQNSPDREPGGARGSERP